MTETTSPKKSGSFYKWLALLTLLPLLLFLLALIPWPSTTLIRPQGTIIVTDQLGKPVVGAEVIVRRYRVGPPPKMASHQWHRSTSNRGEVRFEAMLLGSETVLPLMIHGVPQWGFLLCVKKKGYRTVASPWLTVVPKDGAEKSGRSVPKVSFKLVPGNSSTCPWRPMKNTEDFKLDNPLKTSKE